jgi:hypothetical protein
MVMDNCRRPIFQFAIAAGIAALLSTVPPAKASEGDCSLEANTVAKSSTGAIKRRDSHVAGIAAAHRNHRLGTISRPDCSGAWCGRQFVLMVGVAY